MSQHASTVRDRKYNPFHIPAMSENEVEKLRKTVVVAQANASTETTEHAMYHVRLTQSWPPNGQVTSSFYGLHLELRGNPTDLIDSSSPHSFVAVLLDFTTPSSLLTPQLESLKGIRAPFEVLVQSKTDASSVLDGDENTLTLLQLVSNVQVGNQLVEINGERFLLDASATGVDIYHTLWSLASQTSLAKPLELTLQRHNFAHMSAKIVPFAQRQEVQNAHVAQQQRILAEDAALPENVRWKKLFLMHQLDYEREQYLVPHVAASLQALHTKVMRDGEWQAFEAGKTLWYFHAPTSQLYAQHPLRNHPEARRLVKQGYDQVYEAVRRLERQIQSYLWRKRLKSAVLVNQENEKRQEQLRRDAVRKVEHCVQAHQNRKRLVALMKAEKEIKRNELRVTEKQPRSEEEQLELLNRVMKEMKLQQEQLQDQVAELKLQLEQTQVRKLPVDLETQTRAIDRLREEEHQRIQERLDKVEMELLCILTQEKPTCSSSTSKVDTREWKRYLTLLRVPIKKKKKRKQRHAASMLSNGLYLSAAPNQLSPSWHKDHEMGDNMYYMKSTLRSRKQDELDMRLPPTRAFNSFFAAEFTPTNEQLLPSLNSSRNLVVNTPVYQSQQHPKSTLPSLTLSLNSSY